MKMSLQEKITFYEMKSGAIQRNKRFNQHQLLQTKGLLFENNNICDRMNVTCTYIKAHIVIYECVHQVLNDTLIQDVPFLFFTIILKVVDYRVVNL